MSHPLIALANEKNVRQAAQFHQAASEITPERLAELYAAERAAAPSVHDAGRTYFVKRTGKPATERRTNKDEEHLGAALVRASGEAGFELPDDLFQEQARRRVALGLVIAEVVKANEIKVDRVRVREVVEDMASTYEQPQDVIDYYYSDKGHLASVESLTLEDQVVDWVMENAHVEDVAATFEELTSPAARA